MALRDDLIATVPQAIRDSRDAQAVADAYNAGRVRIGSLDRAQFLTWAAATGVRSHIEDHAADTASPLRASSLAIRDVFLGAAAGIDLSDPDNRKMLAAWVAAGDINQTQADTLIAKATVPDPIDELTIRAVCWSDDGVWQL